MTSSHSSSPSSPIRVGIGRSKPEHHFGQRGGQGIAFQVSCQTDVQAPEIKGREDVQLPMFLHQELGLTFAQQLKGATKAAPCPEGSLCDSTLHAVCAGGQSDNLRCFTVPKRGKNDCGRRDQRHGPPLELKLVHRLQTGGRNPRQQNLDGTLSHGYGPDFAVVRLENVDQSILGTS